MGGIFVSYRRDDSSGSAGRLFDRLTHRFGREAVFMDVEGSIPRGSDFSAEIARALHSAAAVIVVIGPRWLTCTDGEGHRRLDRVDDWVRTEIETGLDRAIPVIPVLVDSASMPAADQLPPTLKPFALRQSSEITNSRWNYDVGELVSQLERAGITPLPEVPATSERTSRRAIWLAAALLAVGGGAAVVSQRGCAQAPLDISFDVWQDLRRDQPNVANVRHKYVAAVIYGSPTLDVRDINLDTVRLSDGTGSAVPPRLSHLQEGYDENRDGFDDLKLDYEIADLQSSANKLLPSSTFVLNGRLKDDKGRRIIRGQRAVTIVDKPD